MTAALCLIAYGTAVAFIVPRLLSRRTCLDRAPAFGVVIWLAAMVSAVAAFLAAVVLAGVAVVGSPGARHVIDRCLDSFCAAAIGAHGSTVQWLTVGGVLVAAIGVGAAALGTARALLHARRGTRRHAETARLLGQHDRGLGALVVDVPQKLAYAVAGRPSEIVLSSAALQALTPEQLDVILAHERAHLAGRHHLVLAVARALATVAPAMRLFTTGTVELGRLVEMCADDVAVRGRDARSLIGAMIALAGPVHLPDAALGGAASSVSDRAERLATRPGRTAVRTARGLLLSGTSALLCGPLVTALVLCDLLPPVA